MVSHWSYDTLVGRVTFSEQDGVLIRVAMNGKLPEGEWRETPLLREASVQWDAYLKGQRQAFSLPSLFKGTPFQEAVWSALLEITYGETRSYKQIAEAIGFPRAYRAVGRAAHENPLLIIIPCHRVIGSDQKLTGFVGGVQLKKFLLELESDEVLKQKHFFSYSF